MKKITHPYFSKRVVLTVRILALGAVLYNVRTAPTATTAYERHRGGTPPPHRRPHRGHNSSIPHRAGMAFPQYRKGYSYLKNDI